MHIIAAQNVVRWARKRYEMGLGGTDYSWEDGEETWPVMGSHAASGNLDSTERAHRSTDDVAPGALADPDSRFVECGGLTVHYKEACIPTVRSTSCSFVSTVTRGSRKSVSAVARPGQL